MLYKLFSSLKLLQIFLTTFAGTAQQFSFRHDAVTSDILLNPPFLSKGDFTQANYPLREHGRYSLFKMRTAGNHKRALARDFLLRLYYALVYKNKYGGYVSGSQIEKWVIRLVFIAVILTACTAVASLKVSSYLLKVQDETSSTANRKADFFLKSIHDHSFRLQMEVFELNKLLGTTHPGIQKFIEGKVKEYDETVAHYQKEKEKIEAEKQSILKHVEESQKHNKNFTVAIILLQSAILMAAVGVLLQKRILWISCLGISTFGLLYMINGFFLWF